MSKQEKEEVKQVKQFSRRHQTNEAHNKAHQAYDARQTAKLEGAKYRTEAAINRTSKEQIQRLDKRLGVGVGAKKERARLKSS